MRNIYTGDSVVVNWVTDGMQVRGIVENVPTNVGDLWYIRTSDGTVMAVNPVCSDLMDITKFNKEAQK